MTHTVNVYFLLMLLYVLYVLPVSVHSGTYAEGTTPIGHAILVVEGTTVVVEGTSKSGRNSQCLLKLFIGHVYIMPLSSSCQRPSHGQTKYQWGSGEWEQYSSQGNRKGHIIPIQEKEKGNSLQQ